MAEDLTSIDFFRDGRLTDDPYPFYEALRNKCPVNREGHYGVTMVTGGRRPSTSTTTRRRSRPASR